MKDVNTIIEEIVNRAKELAPNLLWEPQSVLSRLILTVPAKEFSNVYILLEYFHRLMSFRGLMSLITDESFKNDIANALRLTLSDVERLIENDIEAVGERYNVVRKKARPSSGIVDLYFYVGSSVFVPENIIFKTKTGLEFTNVLGNINKVPIYDSATGLYKFSLVVRCLREGAVGNIPANFITDISISLPNLALVTNPFPFINGEDKEDLMSYVSRITNMLSVSPGSKSWLENFFFSDENVLDVRVVTCNEKEFLRRYGADVWVVDYEELDEVQVDEDFIYVNFPPVVKFSNATLERRNPEEDVYVYSIYGVEKLYREEPDFPIRYWADKTIYYLQQKLLYPEWYFLGGEKVVIVRKALPAYVYVKVDVYKSVDVSSEFLKEQIKFDLNVFFSGGVTSYGKKYTRCRLGRNIDISDLVNVIIDNPNVDRVDLDNLVVKILPNREASFGQLLLKVYEYPVLSSNSVINVK